MIFTPAVYMATGLAFMLYVAVVVPRIRRYKVRSYTSVPNSQALLKEYRTVLLSTTTARLAATMPEVIEENDRQTDGKARCVKGGHGQSTHGSSAAPGAPCADHVARAIVTDKPQADKPPDPDPRLKSTDCKTRWVSGASHRCGSTGRRHHRPWRRREGATSSRSPRS